MSPAFLPEAPRASWRLGEVPGLRNPHAAPGDREAARLFPVRQVVVQQVPDPLQAHRRHLQDMLPAGIRLLQPSLLDDVSAERGEGGIIMRDIHITLLYLVQWNVWNGSIR